MSKYLLVAVTVLMILLAVAGAYVAFDLLVSNSETVGEYWQRP